MGKHVRYIPLSMAALLIAMFVFLSFFNFNVSAGDASIIGTITDENTNDPLVNADVTVSYSENGTVVATTKTDSTGYYQVTGLSPGHYTVKIEAEGYHNESQGIEILSPQFGEGDTYEVNAFLIPIPEKGGDGPPSEGSLYSFIFLSSLIILIVFVISLVMYSKIKRENMLKNAVRKRIFDYIKENPGMHYRAILNGLDLPMGVLSYHINRLEKAQYIKSRQDGMFRRFFVKGPKTEMRFFLSDIQESILTVIRENQGISQSKIAEKISVSRKVVNYHVNILDQAGLIFVESRGRESACYPNEPITWDY